MSSFPCLSVTVRERERKAVMAVFLYTRLSAVGLSTGQFTGQFLLLWTFLWGAYDVSNFRFLGLV